MGWGRGVGAFLLLPPLKSVSGFAQHSQSHTILQLITGYLGKLGNWVAEFCPAREVSIEGEKGKEERLVVSYLVHTLPGLSASMIPGAAGIHGWSVYYRVLCLSVLGNSRIIPKS